MSRSTTTSAPAAPWPASASRASLAILGGGLLAGGLDILDAIIVWRLRTGATAERIFQSVASGLLGRAAFQGGLETAALGAVLHFFIATTAAAVYVLASRRLEVLVRRAVPCGLAYGVAVFFFVRDVVLPLSAVPKGQGGFSSFLFLNGILIHALGVGLPIALCARRAQGTRPLEPTELAA